MKLTNRILMFTFVLSVLSCSSEKSSTLPPAPGSVAQVKDFLKGKKIGTQKTGFYASLVINDKPEMEWIDVQTEKGEYEKQVAEELKQFSLQFVNDTAVRVESKGKTYDGTYVVDDKTDEFDKGKEGIKLRVTYNDPDMSFGGLEGPQEVTYTYFVKGIDSKSLLLQFPREVNRRPVIGLMTE
ncbi:MAG TPA: hypothetical protein PKC69_01410 [Chitinophagaceae bacterium]|nr:hypothetical protein [Chitinophagaceae bacterium]